MVVLPYFDYQLCDLDGPIPTNRQTACQHTHPFRKRYTENLLVLFRNVKAWPLATPALVHNTRGVDLFQKMFAIVGLLLLDFNFQRLYP